MEKPVQPQYADAAFWKRTLHMLLFAIAYSIAELILALVVLVQFLSILVTGRASERLLELGNSLSSWVRQVFRFVTYNTEDMPFPFGDWPQEPAGGARWRESSGAAVDVPAGAARTAQDAGQTGPAPRDAAADGAG